MPQIAAMTELWGSAYCGKGAAPAPGYGPALGGAALPDLEELAGVMVKAADGLSLALSQLSEDNVSDGIEASLQSLAALLDQLAERLPLRQEDCEALAQALEAASAARHGCSPEEPCCCGEGVRRISREEALMGIRAIAAVMLDVRTSLHGISKDEIREIVEAGLPLARMFASAAQRSAAHVQQRVIRQKGPAVVIEDLSDEDSLAEPDELPITVTLQSPRRYLWRPLWPRLQAQVWPQCRARCTEFATSRPLLTAAVAMASTPAAACGAYWLAVALLADAALQRTYAWKGSEIEDAVEGAVRTANFSYLSARLLARHSLRVVQRQAERALDGRTPSDLARDVAKEVCEDPLGSAQVAAGHVASAARWAGGRLCELPRWAASARDAANAAWHCAREGGLPR